MSEANVVFNYMSLSHYRGHDKGGLNAKDTMQSRLGSTMYILVHNVLCIYMYTAIKTTAIIIVLTFGSRPLSRIKNKVHSCSVGR